MEIKANWIWTMANYSLTIIKDTSRFNDLTKNITLLTKDSKIMANQSFLQVASPVINKAIMENPDSTIFDFKHHSDEAVNGLLEMIYKGQVTDIKDEALKDEVFQLTEELGINVRVQSLLHLPGPEAQNIKVEPPKVPEEQEKNDDPGLFKMDNGRYGCGICFKSFVMQAIGKRHYQSQHMIDKNVKNFGCRFPNCNKKFAVEEYMKTHMLRAHGVSAKMLKSATKAPSKGMKEEPQPGMKQELQPVEQ